MFSKLKSAIFGPEKTAAEAFPCSFCKGSYVTREELRVHVNQFHRCVLCNEVVATTVIFQPDKQIDDMIGSRRSSLKTLNKEATRVDDDEPGETASPAADAKAEAETSSSSTSAPLPASTTSSSRCCLACATARRDLLADLREAAQAQRDAEHFDDIRGVPRLQHVGGAIDSLSIYETRSRLYIVGGTQDRRRYSILKIERCTGDELPITEDKIQYTRAEKDELLDMINKGNKAQGGLTKVCDAFGILGFVRFLQGYYLVIITKRRPIALVGRNRVYAIDEVSNLYLPPQDAAVTVDVDSSTEKRYKDLFFGLDLTKGFYFSASYDLTHTMQHNMAAATRARSAPRAHADALSDRATQFVWNAYLLQPLCKLALTRWVLPVVGVHCARSEMHLTSSSVDTRSH